MTSVRPHHRTYCVFLAIASMAVPSCSSDPENAASSTAGGPGGAGGAGGDGPATIYDDLPGDPIIEDGLPADVPGLFAGAPGSDSGGPCLSEPAIDAMIPKNWTPLLFEWTPPPEQNVFELRLRVDNQQNELVAYTSSPTFTIAAATWKSLTAHSAGHDIEITLRGATLSGGSLTSGPFTGAEGSVHIAPVEAPGSVVYWTSSDNTSFQGFVIGDTTPVTVLTPPMVGPTSTGGNTTCVSCHTSSPDGKLVVYSRDADDGSRAIDIRMVDGSGAPQAADVSPAALALLGRTKQTAPLMSPAHYAAGDAVALSVLEDAGLTAGRSELAWTDLHAVDASGWGLLARTGDPGEVSSPAWRHDGSAVAYVSSDSASEGVIADAPPGGAMDIYVVPYNDRAGGAATPLPGASDAAYREFYPVYSPNDVLLAFNRTDQPVSSYNQPSAEVFVLPAEGGQPLRLAANDPPACTGLTSPGITNSWARWAPKAGDDGGKRYYWLVFSSKRRALSSGADGLLPQLYIAAVVTTVVDGMEAVEKDYPALYVTSQIPSQNNHTPAWDFFEVQSIPK